MTHEMDRNRVKKSIAPPPADALTDAPQKKKPWTKPTILVLEAVETVLAGNQPMQIEHTIDAYSPSS